MAQIVVHKIGEVGYGKNKKPPPYIPRNEAGVPLSDMRRVDDRSNRDPNFTTGNKV